MANQTLKRDEFSKFLNCIKLIQDVCTDCDLQKGVIRQRTNDRHAIVEMDLSSVLNDSTICFTLLKQKIALLKSLELDDSARVGDDEKDITVELNEKTYKFIDIFSTLTFRIPIRKFLDNTFVSADEVSNMFELKEEDLVLSYNVSSYMCRRIKSITEGFNTDVLVWKMNGFDSCLQTESSNKDNSAQLIKNIALNSEMTPMESKMISLPLCLDINSDIEINGYKIKDGQVLLCRFRMKYFDIPITIYAQSQLTKTKG